MIEHRRPGVRLRVDEVKVVCAFDFSERHGCGIADTRGYESTTDLDGHDLVVCAVDERLCD